MKQCHMKRRKAWVWTVTYPTARWFGTCPVWAAQPLPAGAVVTRQRVIAYGPLERCAVPGCNDSHVRVPSPF